jgi:hypothetical protein
MHRDLRTKNRSEITLFLHALENPVITKQAIFRGSCDQPPPTYMQKGQKRLKFALPFTRPREDFAAAVLV